MLSPKELVDATIKVAENKSEKTKNLILLGILAGIFIGFGAFFSSMVSFSLLPNNELFSIGRLLAGAVFPIGLILIVNVGGELFTGNCLMISATIDRKIKLSKLLKNYGIVYFSNLAGSVLLAFLIANTSLIHLNNDTFSASIIKVAANKCSLDFSSALTLGILCNALVCLAVVMSFAAPNFEGKCLACFLPIFTFVGSSFEHSVANMFYIPFGLFTKSRAGSEIISSLDPNLLSHLSLKGFLVDNLLPVTLGNIIGGFFIAIIYYIIYKK